MFILIPIFFFHFFFGTILENFKNNFLYFLANIAFLAVVFYFTLGITDTADTFMFKYFFDNDWDKIDPMFIFLTKMSKMYKLDYFGFYKLHLIVYTITYFIFISKYTKNVFYVFLVFFVLNYVSYVNQFRYYLSFPFFLLSIYYLLQKRNLLLFIIFTILAVISHSAIAILYLFIPLYYFTSTKSFFKTTVYLSAIVFVIVIILFQLGIVQQLDHFGEYFSKGKTSSVAGGIFNAVPYFIYIAYIWIIDRKYRKNNPECDEDKTYTILRKLSYFSIIFIPASFFVQVLGHRYVFPFLIIWCIFFLYTVRNQSSRNKFLSFATAGFVHLLAAFTIYIMPYFVLGESFYIDELYKSMKSIKYFEFLYLFKN